MRYRRTKIIRNDDPSYEEVLVWSEGDRYYKLAQHFYGDSAHWWIIAWFNKKPTEGHINFGDLIYVPLPLERVISYYGV